MKSSILVAALLGGLITVTFCIIGPSIPFRPEAMSERSWGTLWTIVGLIVGIIVAKRLAKRADRNPSD